MKQSKRLFSFTARSIMALRFHKEEFICQYDDTPKVYTQIDVLFWIPFTPIFFIYKIDLIGDTGREDFTVGIISYWKSLKIAFTKLPYGLYRVHHTDMYKRKNRRHLPMLPGKRSTLVFVEEENGIAYRSPRDTALRWLRGHNYVSKESILSEIVS